ncbi:hypothetical protein A1O7_09881 [Cladophialophora yegresii CBS 114405]|uniref:Uncharacterized protein n=1 Tax=Cladophialophora yegresii CBS 114405 TaxID=1182544 RepID=W9VQV3_9EURO|nr:uncharacterized protein A1O7_09881 [Cladophialophora yegresii CBS 114405]EXJ54541.1 hypothetical protein A1O7_09881 [Cladophialophora yegresii CBS 114405]
MRRLTRRSGVHRSVEVDEQDAEDVTAILNEEAAAAARPPSRKRRRTSGGDTMVESPSRKRIQLQPLAVTTTSPRRQSTRLQARKSLPAPMRLNNRNLFEYPTEDDGEEGWRKPTEPVKKLRLLKKTLSQNTASPFKGQGELATLTNARINLDDSPRKRRGRPLKETNKLAIIVKSLQKRGRPPKDVSTSAAAAAHLDEDDIFRAAEREDDESSSQLNGQPLGEAAFNDAHPDRLAEKPRRSRGPSGRFLSAARVASPSPEFPESHKTAQESHHQQNRIEKHRRSATGVINPPAEAARLAGMRQQPLARGGRDAQRTDRTAEDDLSIEETVSNERRENDDTEGDSADDEQTKNGDPDNVSPELHQGEEDHRPSQPPPKSQRPHTEATCRAAKRQAAEDKARRQEIINEELAGVEEAVHLHGCKELWATALVGAAEVAEDRASTEVQSTLGKACDRSFEQMTSVFKRMHVGNPERQRKLSDEELDKLGVLVRRCHEISRYSYRPDMYYDRERQKMVRDIYGYLIRRSLRLSVSALKTYFRNNRLSAYAIGKICQLLEITEKLVDSAGKWTPRPGLESGVKSKTKSEIAQPIQSLKKRYNEALVESARSRWLNEHNCLAIQSSMQLEEQHRKWRDSVRTKYSRLMSGYQYQNAGSERHPLSSQQGHVVDVDDIANDESEAPNHQAGDDARQTQAATVRNRPNLRREPTEDIPAPSEPEWTDQELTALTNGLQKHTGESRWEEIMNAYGRYLGKYDMDTLVAKAKWCKQIMASKLEHDMNGEWDWLKSVPG